MNRNKQTAYHLLGSMEMLLQFGIAQRTDAISVNRWLRDVPRLANCLDMRVRVTEYDVRVKELGLE